MDFDLDTFEFTAVQRPVKVSTLYLAVKNGNLAVSRLLLRFGAIPDAHVAEEIPQQVNLTIRWLVQYHDLLQLYLEAGLDRKVRAMHCPHVAWPLIPAIKSGAPPALVQMLIDHGADPNQLDNRGKTGGENLVYYGVIGSRVETPLSVAISQRSTVLVDLLVRAGASISGRTIDHIVWGRPPSYNPTQLPVFAAVKVLVGSLDAGKSMIRLCLRHGGDINQTEFYRIHPTRRGWTTPLLVYMQSSIPSYKLPDPQTFLDRLEFLVAQGASASTPESVRVGRQNYLRSGWEPLPVLQGLICMAADWEKDDNTIFSAAKLLVQRGAADDPGLLTDLVLAWGTYFASDIRPNMRIRWLRFLNIILRGPGVDVQFEFSCYLKKIAASIMDPEETRCFDELDFDTLSVLFVHGADFNGRDASTQETPLYAIYKMLLSYAMNPDDLTRQTDAFTPELKKFIWWLVDKGADRSIAVNGRRAIDNVRHALNSAPTWSQPFIRMLEATLVSRLDPVWC